jgi:ParB family transcriptional regulator, chromosome partitioning protein
LTSKEIPLELIDEPLAPLRGKIDAAELAELCESVHALGILQPLLVTQEDDRYRVVAGHRRLLAARAVKLPLVPCIVLGMDDARSTPAMMLHENLFRANLTAIEEAALYAELFDMLRDTAEVARYVHRSQDLVERRLLLLAGDEKIRAAVQDGRISLGAAEELNHIPEESTRRYLLDAAINDGASVEKVRAWRRMYGGIDVGAEARAALAANPDPASEPQPDPNRCWLCGSSEDQHDLRVRLVHAACERLAIRNAQDAMQQKVGTDG